MLYYILSFKNFQTISSHPNTLTKIPPKTLGKPHTFHTSQNIQLTLPKKHQKTSHFLYSNLIYQPTFLDFIISTKTSKTPLTDAIFHIKTLTFFDLPQSPQTHIHAIFFFPQISPPLTNPPIHRHSNHIYITYYTSYFHESHVTHHPPTISYTPPKLTKHHNFTFSFITLQYYLSHHFHHYTPILTPPPTSISHHIPIPHHHTPIPPPPNLQHPKNTNFKPS